jgi:hypothetical protein
MRAKYFFIAVLSIVLLTSCKQPVPDSALQLSPEQDEQRLKLVRFGAVHVKDPYTEDTKMVNLIFTNTDNAVEIHLTIVVPRSDVSLPNGIWYIEQNNGVIRFDDGERRGALFKGTTENGSIMYTVSQGKLTIADEYIDIDVEGIYDENGHSLLAEIEMYRYDGAEISF